MFTKSNTAGPGILRCHTVKLIKHTWKFLGEKLYLMKAVWELLGEGKGEQQGLTKKDGVKKKNTTKAH